MKKPNITRIKNNLEKRFTDIYGNNPQNQKMLDFILNEIKAETSLTEKNSKNQVPQTIEEKAIQLSEHDLYRTLQPSEKKTSKIIIQKSDKSSSHHGKSAYDLDSQKWGIMVKKQDLKQKEEDNEKLKKVLKQQEQLREQLCQMKLEKQQRIEKDKNSDQKFAEMQKQIIKRQEEISQQNKQIKQKQKKEEFEQTNQYLYNLKKLEKKERKQRIFEEQQEINKILKKMQIEDEEEKNKKLERKLEMQKVLLEYDKDQIRQKGEIEKDKENDRKLMKQNSEIIKKRDEQREQEKNNRLNKIDKIANRFQQTVDKELQERIKEEERKNKKYILAKDEKDRKEEIRKEQSLKKKTIDMIEQLKNQQQYKEKQKIKEKEEDKQLAQQIKLKMIEDEKVSLIKKQNYNKLIQDAAKHQKDQIEIEQKRKKKRFL